MNFSRLFVRHAKDEKDVDDEDDIIMIMNDTPLL
jgi:hypothetical protein